MSTEVFWWWSLLALVGALNVAAWCLSARAFARRRRTLTPEVYRARQLQLLLSAGYVAGCAFRTAFPVQDVPRICLFDAWLSNVTLGRSVATLAELRFAAQGALLLGELARVAASPFGRATALVSLPTIALAELCSWSAVVTGSNLGHVVEESLWALWAAMLVASILAIGRHASARLRRVLAIGCAVGAGYVVFMVLVDVPMYWSRWLADEAAGRGYRGLFDGLADATVSCRVSGLWLHWREEIPWMTLYFSVAVWLSIALVHMPAVERRPAHTASGAMLSTRSPTIAPRRQADTSTRHG